ncbi:hypothetical protein [Shewanella maritima]|uniref:hypothetical protein n=1 Tax=Shewanella maritima TaxID=2520507 RepID=UPI0037356629
MTLKKYLSIILFSLCMPLMLQANDTFILNHATSADDQRYLYSVKLLKLIISETEAEYGEAKLDFYPTTMSRDRTLKELTEGQNINVVAEVSTQQWNKQLLSVQLPIRKGILGYRIFIIRKDTEFEFSQLHTLAQLQTFPTGTISTWSIHSTLQQAGFQLIDGSSYSGLFHMLQKGRFDSFSRGINEAYKEMQYYQPKYTDLMVEPTLLLKVPLFSYFYISPNTPHIAKRIESGLNSLIANGKFDALFFQEHCSALINSQMHLRRTFEISSPHISESQYATMQQQNDLLLSSDKDYTQDCQPYY